MTEFAGDWPEDADGDVFRRLREHSFDFAQPYAVDYNVDFEAWPPSAEAVTWLEREFGRVCLHPPTVDFGGYAQFQVRGPVTYVGVTSIQRRVSAAMMVHGGICESWGVMQPAPTL